MSHSISDIAEPDVIQYIQQLAALAYMIKALNPSISMSDSIQQIARQVTSNSNEFATVPVAQTGDNGSTSISFNCFQRLRHWYPNMPDDEFASLLLEPMMKDVISDTAISEDIQGWYGEVAVITKNIQRVSGRVIIKPLIAKLPKDAIAILGNSLPGAVTERDDQILSDVYTQLNQGKVASFVDPTLMPREELRVISLGTIQQLTGEYGSFN